MNDADTTTTAPAPRTLPENFRWLNLYPLVFDPARVGEETDLEGHAFALELLEYEGKEAIAYVIKTLKETRAIDPLTGDVVPVPAGVAVRVVCSPAMHRLRSMVEHPEAVPHLLFRPELCDGRYRLKVAEGPNPISRSEFSPPTAARAA